LQSLCLKPQRNLAVLHGHFQAPSAQNHPPCVDERSHSLASEGLPNQMRPVSYYCLKRYFCLINWRPVEPGLTASR
jgi:hypothetical protein